MSQPHDSLKKQQEKFKAALRNAPVIKKVIKAPVHVTRREPEPNSYDHLRPDVTETGGQRHLNSYIHSVLSLLKLTDSPQSPQDIKDKISVDLMAHPNLFKAIAHNEKILYEDGKFSFRPVFSIETKEELLRLLFDYKQSGFGLEIEELRESCPELNLFVDELVLEGKVLRMYGKDKSLRFIFYNEYKAEPVDDSFKQMWNNLKVPNEFDLNFELTQAGLQPFQVYDNTIKKRQIEMVEKKKKKISRRIKITNTHMTQ